MIKVLSTEPAPEIIKEVICRTGCGVTLSYTPIDVKEIRYTDVSQTACVDKYIICPACGRTINL